MGTRRRHRVVDIATQAGLSRATVDRVLHGREGVRPETVAQVDRAIAELERQHEQVQLSARTLMLDLVMQSPDRFASAARDGTRDRAEGAATGGRARTLAPQRAQRRRSSRGACWTRSRTAARTA